MVKTLTCLTPSNSILCNCAFFYVGYFVNRVKLHYVSRIMNMSADARQLKYIAHTHNETAIV